MDSTKQYFTDPVLLSTAEERMSAVEKYTGKGPRFVKYDGRAKKSMSGIIYRCTKCSCSGRSCGPYPEWPVGNSYGCSAECTFRARSSWANWENPAISPGIFYKTDVTAGTAIAVPYGCAADKMPPRRKPGRRGLWEITWT